MKKGIQTSVVIGEDFVRELTIERNYHLSTRTMSFDAYGQETGFSEQWVNNNLGLVVTVSISLADEKIQLSVGTLSGQMIYAPTSVAANVEVAGPLLLELYQKITAK